ncbi:MAG: hypothetical protein JWM80_533 [Cyanobacteria bacterium RYN_339]|nr:hypothetical protein [Cyanobacteria bacterium RYN_339]
MESLWGHAPFYLGVPGAEPAWDGSRPMPYEGPQAERGKKDAQASERP